MEKQADPVEKVEGAASLVSEKEEGGKEEAVPGEGATAIDPTKEEKTEGAVLDKRESSKGDSASITSTSVPDFACDSIEEYASASYPESTSQESIATPDEQVQAQATNNCRCISYPKLACIFATFSVASLCVGIFFIQRLIHISTSLDDKIMAVFFSSVGILSLMISLYYVKHGVPDTPAADQSIHYEDLRSEAGSEDVESRRIGSSGSEYLEASERQQDGGSYQSTAGPSREGASSSGGLSSGASSSGALSSGPSSSGVPNEKQPILQPTTSKGDSVMKLSEIASAVSQIASGTTKEGPEDSVREKPKDQNASKKADDNLQNSEQEGLSSTELRRRNFQNPDSCTDLTKTAEAKE